MKDLSAAVSKGSAKARGPSLAAVDLEARRLSRAERIHSGESAGPSGQLGRSTDTPELAAAVLRYFKCVGHLASCAADLRCPPQPHLNCHTTRLDQFVLSLHTLLVIP